MHLALRALIHTGVVKSAHDCSEGGLAVALAECCISRQLARETPCLIGAEIDLRTEPAPADAPAEAAETRVCLTDPASVPTTPSRSQSQAASLRSARLDALLFGESQARIIISVAAIDAVKVVAQAKILGIPGARIGTVGGCALKIQTDATTLEADTKELHDLWWNSIASAMS